MSQDSSPAANNKAKNKPRKKTPKKITESYLQNAGLFYLERFAASSGHFREVMLRKVKKSCHAHPEQNYETCAALVDKLVKKFEDSGLLDDQTYTRSMVSSLRRRGKSARAIHAHLKTKKLDNSLIANALENHDCEDHENAAEAEYQAALTFARKKRIGPFNKNQDIDIQKELGRFARAGFSYDTARIVLNINSDEIEQF